MGTFLGDAPKCVAPLGVHAVAKTTTCPRGSVDTLVSVRLVPGYVGHADSTKLAARVRHRPTPTVSEAAQRHPNAGNHQSSHQQQSRTRRHKPRCGHQSWALPPEASRPSKGWTSHKPRQGLGIYVNIEYHSVWTPFIRAHHAATSGRIRVVSGLGRAAPVTASSRAIERTLRTSATELPSTNATYSGLRPSYWRITLSRSPVVLRGAWGSSTPASRSRARIRRSARSTQASSSEP